MNNARQVNSCVPDYLIKPLERTLGRPAQFWSNLERQYKEDKIRLEAHLQRLAGFPVNNTAKLGWVDKCKDKVKQLEALLRFKLWRPRLNGWSRE
jgi:hypothetical protein